MICIVSWSQSTPDFKLCLPLPCHGLTLGLHHQRQSSKFSFQLELAGLPGSYRANRLPVGFSMTGPLYPRLQLQVRLVLRLVSHPDHFSLLVSLDHDLNDSFKSNVTSVNDLNRYPSYSACYRRSSQSSHSPNVWFG